MKKTRAPKCFHCLFSPVQVHWLMRRNLSHALTWQDHLNSKHVTSIQIWVLLWAKPQMNAPHPPRTLLALYTHKFVSNLSNLFLNYGSLMNISIKIICLPKLLWKPTIFSWLIGVLKGQGWFHLLLYFTGKMMSQELLSAVYWESMSYRNLCMSFGCAMQSCEIALSPSTG